MDDDGITDDMIRIAVKVTIDGDHEWPETELIMRPIWWGPSHHSAHSGHEFLGAKRFGDVVVRTKLEAFDPVLLLGAGSQHDDRYSSGPGVASHEPTHVEPTQSGKH